MTPFFSPADGFSGDTFPFFHNGTCHLFHLRPPTIAHHASRDLVHWERRPEVVSRGPAGLPDDGNIATGCVVEQDGRFLLFYTGNQNICLATSDDLDYGIFLTVLGECCERAGWIIHSYVLMPNHFHLLVETPQGNLVDGMKWFLGAYTQKFNRRHGLKGHAFQGRYKAVVIESEAGGYFEAVSTYVHLNPARARLLNSERPDLLRYRWNSYPAFVGAAERPAWLEVSRVLGNLGLKDDRRGREKYAEHMLEKVKELRTRKGRKIYEGMWKRIRHGWFVGGQGFEETLLGRLKRVVADKKRGSYSGEAITTHDEAEAERLIRQGMKALGIGEDDLERQRKGSRDKCLLAWLVHGRTTVRQEWISRRLIAGAASGISTYARRIREAADPETQRLRASLEKAILLKSRLED